MHDIESDYPTPAPENNVLCERCPFNARILIGNPPEESEKPILDQIDDLRVDYCNLHQIADPHARQEQVMLILGYNKALTDVSKLMVRRTAEVITELDGLCLDDEEDRERFMDAFYGTGSNDY
jgi:hypothetical protein